MAFDLSTPAAQLAWGVYQRGQEVQDYKDKLAEEARARVQAQLAPFGNQNDATTATFNSIYGPAAATQQARAKAMQEYVTGLPELLARVQAEKRSGSGGGRSPVSAFVPQPYVSPEDYLNWLLGGQGGKGQPIAVQKDLGDGRTYGNVGGYGAVYPTGSKGPAVTPVTQRPTRGIGWDGKP